MEKVALAASDSPSMLFGGLSSLGLPSVDFLSSFSFLLFVAVVTRSVNHASLLNTKDNRADVIFWIGGKSVSAHRVILETTCPLLFLNSVKKHASQKKKSSSRDVNHVVALEIDDRKSLISYNSLLALLTFLYSGRVKFFGMEVSDILQTMNTAKIYESENLLNLCKIFLFFSLNESNWFYALKEGKNQNRNESRVVGEGKREVY
jgi:hypothetical protein